MTVSEEQKLVRLGIRSATDTGTAGAGIVRTFKQYISDVWVQFEELYVDRSPTTFQEFKNWLLDNSTPESRAVSVRQTLEAKFASFGDFDNLVRNEVESYREFRQNFSVNNAFRSGRVNDFGSSAAGVRVFNEAGVGRSGQEIPAGGVELFGTEVHFSQTDTVRPTDDESAGTNPPVAFSNLTLSKTTVATGETFQISADVANNTTFEKTVTVEFIVDETVANRQTVVIQDGGSETVTFDEFIDEVGTFDVTVGPLSAKQITVAPPGL